MYEIDFTTCTAVDVINRSITCHPTVLCMKIRNNAAIHSEARRTMIDHTACDSAGQMARDCRCAANMVEHGSPFSSDTRFGVLMQAFSAAASLQCIPFATAQEIFARG